METYLIQESEERRVALVDPAGLELRRKARHAVLGRAYESVQRIRERGLPRGWGEVCSKEQVRDTYPRDELQSVCGLSLPRDRTHNQHALDLIRPQTRAATARTPHSCTCTRFFFLHINNNTDRQTDRGRTRGVTAKKVPGGKRSSWAATPLRARPPRSP